ncbi:hypothetical protein NEMBOFW57_003633 [Staphylotrichum longicolle]|uniref:BTB domain-containing protein n=1 Tax=Staphylotrichum longicolle TaxID=669026 RepID=A0AAD4I4V3_9PEZI|nr:hypothetical protein NEMBOFW57_003633 [Staphylotrichum longicolle]
MQPPKNEGDESDEGDGRSVKRLRTENNAFSHLSTESTRPSLFIKSEGVTTKKEDWLAATVVDAKPVVKMPPAPKKMEVFHVHGDLTLVAGEQGIRFRISSQSLALVSSAWERKINGPFSGKQSQDGADGWVMPLPEDHPDALRIALQVIHYKFDVVPASLSLDIVFHLTVLCDKYDMVGLLKPFWIGWISKLSQPALEPRSLVQQVWVAHKLGHMQLYERAVKEVLSSTTKRTVSGRTQLYLEGHPDFNLSKDPHLLALGLLESWELGRLQLIRQVKAKLDTALRKLSDPKNTACHYAHPDWQKTCDCAMLGGVHRALQGKSWYSSGSINWENQVTVSVRQLVNKLEAVRTEAIGESRMRKKQGSAHKTCTPWERFELTDILGACSLGTDVAPNPSTFEAQARKSGLMAYAYPTSLFRRPSGFGAA